SRRHGDFAIVGIAAIVVGDRGRCASARLVTAGAGPVPVRLRAAEEILEREGLSDAAVEAAARRAAELVDPPSDIHASTDYRRNLTRVLTGRALRRAIMRLNTLSPAPGERAGRGGAPDCPPLSPTTSRAVPTPARPSPGPSSRR